MNPKSILAGLVLAMAAFAPDVSLARAKDYVFQAVKAEVKGPGMHPFYKWAAAERPLDTPRWNFHKYLVGRDGHIAAAFPSEVEPTAARIIAAIAKELAPAV